MWSFSLCTPLQIRLVATIQTLTCSFLCLLFFLLYLLIPLVLCRVCRVQSRHCAHHCQVLLTWCTQAFNPAFVSLIPDLSCIHRLQYKLCINFVLQAAHECYWSLGTKLACCTRAGELTVSELIVVRSVCECSLLSYPSHALVLQQNWAEGLGYHGPFAVIDNTLRYLAVKQTTAVEL